MNFTILGGDKRNIYLTEKLQKEDHNVKTYGFEGTIDNCKTLSEAVEHSEYIIGPTPFSRDDKTLNTAKTILIEEIIQNLQTTQTLIAGKINDPIRQKLSENQIKYVDLLENEALAILNAIPTAEGAIKVAIEQTPICIYGSNVLVLGYGRIGKILSKMLKGMGANVWVEARKDKDITWIKANNYNPIHLNNLEQYLDKMDIIFNTIPATIIDESKISKIKKDSLFIELASKPYGIDIEKAKEKRLKYVIAEGLPGKVAPKSSAYYIYDVICQISTMNKQI